MIISTKEAFNWLEKGDVIFVDCRFSLQDPTTGRKAYEEEHIPGSVYFDLEEDLSGEVGATGGRHPLPDLNEFTIKLGERGITKNTTIIVYDENLAFASRFFWMMKLIGHKNIYLLDGGWKAWLEEDMPLSSKAQSKEVINYGAVQIDESMIAKQEEVKSKKENEQVKLLDSRNFERYAGHKEPIDRKAGHIPNALNYDWTHVKKDDGTLKSEEELKHHFSDLKDASDIIVYCGSGVTAAPNVISLWLAGFRNVKLYVGSFSDWITNDSNEVATIQKN
ncbi:sulfurtransferase [Halalkalibacillus sediminis]|uniref:Sulfurtransferase n=1 Tax=Halalkalibacillus sediminis TaxID=2018042 RepID=A0A2I0QWW4_9BACI|nr:sulfurtransferase [Halalkalibacillus sediminis]PKR78808.1 sulfurtransferase [Halalkalibacillus sediminis]